MALGFRAKIRCNHEVVVNRSREGSCTGFLELIPHGESEEEDGKTTGRRKSDVDFGRDEHGGDGKKEATKDELPMNYVN